MVSKAREDLPDPLRPVMTTSLSRGISTSRFLRLCSRAPRMTIELLTLTSPVDFPAVAYRYNLDDLLFVIYGVQNAILSDAQPIFFPVRQFLDHLRPRGVL